MAQNFLIRWGDEFLLSWEAEPRWTSVPSLAAHFSYEDADETAQDLQEIGYDGCVVTDVFGEIATLNVIHRKRARVGGTGVVLASHPEYSGK